MTRADADKIVAKLYDSAGPAPTWVDIFVELGMLKLDDPAEQYRLDAISYLEEKFVEVNSTGISRHSGRLTRDGAAEILDILIKCGFKITR